MMRHAVTVAITLLLFTVLNAFSAPAGCQDGNNSDTRLTAMDVRSLIESLPDVKRGNGPENAEYGTAGQWFSMAYDYALSWSSDALPVIMFNTDSLATNGTSRGWGYSFYSESFDSVYYVQVIDADVKFGQPQPPLNYEPITGEWIDTDEVVPLVEVHGGSAYRDTNTGVLVQAFLTGEAYDSCRPEWSFWTVGYTSDTSTELDFYVRADYPVLWGYEADCSGVNIGVSSAHILTNIQALTWADDAQLYEAVSLGPVDDYGASPGWAFSYYSMERNTRRYFHTCDDSLYANRRIGILRGNIPAPAGDGWVDSQGVMEIAGTSGGTEFKGEHPLCEVTLSLVNPNGLLFDEHVWQACYDDLYGDQLNIFLGAYDAAFRGAYNINRNLDSLYMAATFVTEATSAAIERSEDSYLYGIVSVEPLSSSPGGSSSAWSYLFHSPGQETSISVTVQPTIVEPRIAVEEFADPIEPGGFAPGWIGSDSALVIAGQAGGDIVGGGILEPEKGAFLAKGLYEVQPELLVWRVVYETPCHTGLFHIDAYTGEVLDGVVGDIADDCCSPRLPRTVMLFQNYPNPFNPSTIISYSVSGNEPVTVDLAIYDLHGRLVRTLVDGVRERGSYSVMWNGESERGETVGSGVYFVKLNAGTEQSIRKILLQK